MYELGAGPEPIRRARLEMEGLTRSLGELAHNAGLREAARGLGEQIRAEKGIEEAVQLSEETFF